MANKLKDMFSAQEPTCCGEVVFADKQIALMFKESMKKLQENGEPFMMSDGVGLNCYQKAGDIKQPIYVGEGKQTIEVSLSPDEVPVDIEVEGVAKTVLFERYQTPLALVLKLKGEPLVQLRVGYSLPVGETGEITINYSTYPEKASSFSDVLDAFQLVLAIIHTLAEPDKRNSTEADNASFSDLCAFFTENIPRIQRMQKLEEILAVHFAPQDFDDNAESQNVDLLYWLLVEKKPIRNDGAQVLTQPNTFNITPKQKIEIGQPIDLNFLSQASGTICQQDIKIYMANHLTNAIIKSVVSNQDGTVELTYGDSDSAPMYLSYKGFLSEAEAEQEMRTIMDHKQDYVQALTLEGYSATLE